MFKLIEELSAHAWPSINTHLYDGWFIGESKGYTKRANSVRVVEESLIPLDKKIKYCEDFYRQNNLSVIFKIVDDMSFYQLDSMLDETNYKKASFTSVRMKDISKSNFFADPNVCIEYEPSDKWVDMYFKSSGKNNSYKRAFMSIIKNIKQKCIWASYKVDDDFLGFGFAVVEKKYCGIFNIFVLEECRGRGYAKAIMNKLLHESRKLGVDKSYLQVEEDNDPAKKLYDNLGYKEIYRYYYRILE